jgi:hypothetical protein
MMIGGGYHINLSTYPYFFNEGLWKWITCHMLSFCYKVLKSCVSFGVLLFILWK